MTRSADSSPRRTHARDGVSGRMRIAAVATALLIPLVVGGVSFGALLALHRPATSQLAAARAVGRLLRWRLVNSVIYVGGATVRGECLTGSFRPFRSHPPEQGEFLVLSNGARLLNTGHGPRDLVDVPVPTDVLNAEWALAGCSGVLRTEIGTRLGGGIAVHVSPAGAGDLHANRLRLRIGGSSYVDYYFQSTTYNPLGVLLANHEPNGWSTLTQAPLTRAAKRSLIRLLLSGQVEHFQQLRTCLLYTSPSPRDRQKSRMPSSA